ncbi:MAG: hypothetical protein V3W04_00790 [Gammaproteobacteria bacterium]
MSQNKMSDKHILRKLIDRQRQDVTQTSFLLLLSMLITACGGGSGGSSSSAGGAEDLTVLPVADLSGTFSYLGYIDLTDDSVENRVNIDSNFFGFIDLQAASTFASAVPIIEDSCSARVRDTIPTNPGTIGFPEVPFNLLVNASMTLTSPAGTYANVLLDSSSGIQFNIAPYPLPDELILDLAGGTFPAFSSVTVPAIPEIENFLPQTITAGIVFTWNPLDTNTGSIYMDFVSFAAPTVADPLIGKYVEIYCRMENDGEFALPQAVEDILNEGLGSGFSLSDVKRARRATNAIVQGDAVFILTRQIESF